MSTIKKIRRKQAKFSRDTLSDSYLIGLLQKGTSLKASDIRKYPELIECKRIQIKFFRFIHA